MESRKIRVNRADLGQTAQVTESLDSPADNQVLLKVDRIGLSANNISYASAGDALGYWAHFSDDDTWGVVPVWGFGTVVESANPAIAVGENVFGFLPMASHAVLTPDAVTDVTFSDESSQRSALHPWYKRYYRCGNDPLFDEELMDTQPVLWALFMTGWMMAEELRGEVDCVFISSASSKTALSLAWSLAHCGEPVNTVGLTSSANRGFVESLGVYSKVVTYDDIQVDPTVTKAAYVDIAGNAQVTSDAHVALGDKLKDSVLIGATHRAPAAEPLPMPGPAPRFFFIPNVAEEKAAANGFNNYHQDFAAEWKRFAAWANTWLSFDHGSGADAVERGYQACFAGGLPANSAMVFTWD